MLHVTISVEMSKSGHHKNLIRLLGYIKLNEFTVNVYKGLWGVQRFSLQYLWKMTVRTTKKHYTLPKGKILYVVGKPCNMISPQSVNITGFLHNIHNISL